MELSANLLVTQSPTSSAGIENLTKRTKKIKNFHVGGIKIQMFVTVKGNFKTKRNHLHGTSHTHYACVFNSSLFTCCQWSSSDGWAEKYPVSWMSCSSRKILPLGRISMIKFFFLFSRAYFKKSFKPRSPNPQKVNSIL